MIPFAPFLPDLAALNANASFTATNVAPSGAGFLPVSGFASVSNTLTARAQGAISVRGLSGTIHNFCGDATKLYKLDSTGTTWSDVTRASGGAYATASDGWWDFTLFGDRVVATNGVDAVQVFQLDVDSKFSALAGSPPVSSFTGNVRDFAILARGSANWNRIRWSAINNVADWVASSTTMSDYQDFPDGGTVMGFVGGEFGIVLLERAIYRMAFEGPPTVFRFDRIANTLGCRVERSIAAYNDLMFFLSNDGFYMIQGGSQITPIGIDKVDRTFEAEFQASLPYLCSAAIDPIKKLYLFAYPGNGASTAANTILCYHWPTGQWSKISADVEIIYAAATQSGTTFDNFANLDTLPYAIDSRVYTGSGHLLLAAFDTTKALGYFSGPNLAATIETGDTQLTPGRKSLLRSLRPMIDGNTVNTTNTVRSRDNLDDTYTDAMPVTVNSIGTCPVRVNARYHRARLTIPAAANWNFAMGLDDPDFTATGTR